MNTTKYVTKTSQVRQLIAQGEKKAALAIASTFRIGVTREDQRVMKKGYECFHFGDTYRQMGLDPEKAIADAWELLVNHPVIAGA